MISPFPFVDYESMRLRDGALVPACSFCKKAFASKVECGAHYELVRGLPSGYYQCPFGFTTRVYTFRGKSYATTGVVAFPRFGSSQERLRGKDNPEARVARTQIDQYHRFLSEAEDMAAEAIQSAAKVLPQAFHELRKLNGAVLQHAERELNVTNSPALQTIKSAAELMRNNFDILEALSNIDVMRAMPLDATINLFDLVYKTRKVYETRAQPKRLQISVTGVRAMIPGSQKSFPIVPAVLIENAIKYSIPNSTIECEVSTAGNRAVLRVENQSEFHIDVVRCFERGTRFAADAAEGGGFGLFLAREVVTAHRGTIRCEREPGRVRMIVDLPLERVVP
jgi:signal transduction histidine kinase